LSSAWDYLQKLCDHPHRGSATAAEAAAAADLRQYLAAMGYPVTTQSFAAPRDTLYLGPSFVCVGFLTAAAIASFSPALGLLLCSLCLMPLVGEMLGGPVDFDLLLPRYPSQNVWARLAPAGERKQTIVLSAHYDTQRASWLFHPRFRPFLQGYFYLVYGTLALLMGALLCRLINPNAGWSRWLLACASLGVAVHLGGLLLCRFSGRYVQGANDNGSGTALVLAMADRFRSSPLEETELIFLLTGAEEVGTRGMKRYLKESDLPLSSTYFINLDNLGTGELCYLLGEGMLTYYRYGADLLLIAEELSREYGDRIHPRKNLLLPTDGLIPAQLGYQAITFIAFAPDGQPADYHWYTDTLQRIDPGQLAFMEEFLHPFIQRLSQLSSNVTALKAHP
jgi:hypothetical protein